LLRKQRKTLGGYFFDRTLFTLHLYNYSKCQIDFHMGSACNFYENLLCMTSIQMPYGFAVGEGNF